jgi:hypothetical protein
LSASASFAIDSSRAISDVDERVDRLAVARAVGLGDAADLDHGRARAGAMRIAITRGRRSG